VRAGRRERAARAVERDLTPPRRQPAVDVRLTPHHHRLVLVPEARVELDEHRADRVAALGRDVRHEELDVDAGRVRRRGRERRHDVGARARALDRAAVVDASAPIGLDVDHERRAAVRERRLGAEARPRRLEQADVAERRVVEPRQVLPIEHVLPHALERRGDGAIVGGDRHERHAPLVLAAAPLGVNRAA